MLTCPSCSSSLAEGSRFCPQCGETLVVADEGAQSPTVTAARHVNEAPPGIRIEEDSPDKGGVRAVPDRSMSQTSPSIDQARFTAGTVLNDRYRVVGLLGKGGMGEVYRADDLKLRQPVALKFLPEALARDSLRRERFHHEVRIAREVSHPNVCRVYDLGDAEGQPFITMEFVDGEDLASVLRRLGRPSPDKALQIARQLCAGLAAAHDKGVLHRDLKPHNVMIDGQGRVRITDFGLAGFVEDFAGKDIRAGTPAYMAPEQLAGRGVSVKSDIYSLGLVLFELFTERRPFEGDTAAEQLHSRSSSSLSGLSVISDTVDPAVERVILRCLNKEPSARPSSALAVAAALPGGDPLAAALAAGETPDPSMVAAAGEVGGLRPAVAVTWLVATLVGLAVVVALNQKVKLVNRMALPHPPQVLAAKARELIADLGYEELPVDSSYAFNVDRDYIRHVTANDQSLDRWAALDSGAVPAIRFWYRQSPEYLEPVVFFGGGGKVIATDPPADQSGMVQVKLDPAGMLYHLTVVPPQVQKQPEETAAPDWSVLFDHAGLDLTKFTQVGSTWTPPVWGDTRSAWTGKDPNLTNVELRVEAAAYHGKPVYFERVLPWTRPERMKPPAKEAGQTASNAIVICLFLTILVGSILVARRNLRLNRGDRRGASRLALFVLVSTLLAWMFSAHHVPTFYEFGLFVIAAGWSLFLAAIVWLVYIALEPYVRRRWPHALISWSRLLAGRIRDPLVGRDLLVGALIGTLMSIGFQLAALGATWFGDPPPAPYTEPLDGLLGVGHIAAELFGSLSIDVFITLGLFFLLYLLRSLLRKVWLAAIAFILILATDSVIGSEDQTLQTIVTVAFDVLIVVVLLRFGVLALVSVMTISQFLSVFPMTYDFNAWYFRSSLVAILAIVVIAAYAFHTALAGRPLFKDELLET